MKYYEQELWINLMIKKQKELLLISRVSDHSSIMKYEEEEVVPNAWSSELPADILGLITDKVRSMSPSVYIRFGSVCFEWRSFCIENYQHIMLPSKLPVLLIPLPSSPTTTDKQKYVPSPPSSSTDEEEEEEVGVGVGVKEVEEDEGEDEEEEEEEEVQWYGNYYDPEDFWQGQFNERYKCTRNFYSIYEKRVYHDFPLPVPYYKNIRGSSHGWLVTVEERCRHNGKEYYPVRLFNPFRTYKNKIQLPPLCPLVIGERPNDSYYLQKAFLSANPSALSDPTTELVVLGVSCHYRLAFCRPGDKEWTPLKVYRPIQDIISYQGQFYAILQNGFVFAFVFDAAQLHPTVTVTGLLPPEENGYPPKGEIMRYLVESAGELLQIRRDVRSTSSYYKTSQFLVFKLDPMDPSKWVETKTLNDRMLFLGSSCTSMSLSALDFPGCKPNSIYYTDDYACYIAEPWMGPHDIGVFNVEDGSFEPHYAVESKIIMPPPIWIQPML